MSACGARDALPRSFALRLRRDRSVAAIGRGAE